MKDKFYVEVVRSWKFSSYSTEEKCMTYAHPMFLIKKRHLFKKDEIVKIIYGTRDYDVERALDIVRELNGCDWVPNAKKFNWEGFFNVNEKTY